MSRLIKMFGQILMIALIIFTLTPNKAEQPKLAQEASAPTQKMELEAKELDPRAVILRDYLTRYDSPLVDYSQDFIDAADAYNVDWKLVPSIAGVESTFGKNIPGGYNGWGWGVYGTQAIYFNSWRDGIFTVTKGLRENYINRGMNTPYEINYAYASSPYWGGHVVYFMQDLERFAQSYPQSNNLSLGSNNPDKKTAGVSAQLTLALGD